MAVIIPGPEGLTQAKHREQAYYLLAKGLESIQATNAKADTPGGMPAYEAQVQLAGAQALLLAAQVHATLAGPSD